MVALLWRRDVEEESSITQTRLTPSKRVEDHQAGLSGRRTDEEADTHWRQNAELSQDEEKQFEILHLPEFYREFGE